LAEEAFARARAYLAEWMGVVQKGFEKEDLLIAA
jgi:hypothetical protein